MEKYGTIPVIKKEWRKFIMKNLSEFNINGIMSQLSQRRPIFHNERDFQFELAKEIESIYEVSNVRLEYFFSDNFNEESGRHKKEYIDIVVFDKENRCILLELKYKKCNAKTVDARKETTPEFKYNKECFYLNNSGARNFSCYDVLRDLFRLERLTNNLKTGNSYYNFKDKQIVGYYTILLTNELGYRDIGFIIENNFAAFDLKANADGEVIINNIEYEVKKPEAKNSKGRKDNFKFKQSYKSAWKYFSDNGEKKELQGEGNKTTYFIYLALGKKYI
jgi:hypothetical protein